MLDFVQKRKIRGVAYHRITLIVLGILVLFFIHSTYAVYQKKRESASARRISEQNLAQLEARDRDLKGKIDRLQTDSGVEEEIRSKFSVAKTGENMVIVVEDPNAATTTVAEPDGFWQKLKALFDRK